MQKTLYVFVYGTLRRGGSNDITRLQPSPRLAGQASVAGLMYDLGPYPGLILGGPQTVYGEIYQISAELERQLDVIEEVWPQPTGEYVKRLVYVRLGEGDASDAQPRDLNQSGELACIVYEVAMARTIGRAVVAGGDWILHMHQSGDEGC
jgi:gamma-glutamylcyclotransferase (GGCT)/AIG2-like uncharacterized protein YtfP